MRDSRKFCFPKIIKSPKTGDVLITLKNGKQAYISFQDLEHVKFIIDSYVVLEDDSSSDSDSNSDSQEEQEDVDNIGTINKSSSILTIEIDDNALPEGTYSMVYEDSTGTPLQGIDKITEFTIS